MCGMRCSNAFVSEVRGAFGVGEVMGNGSLNRPVLGTKVDNPSIIMEDCSRHDVLSLKLFIKNYIPSFDPSRMFFDNCAIHAKNLLSFFAYVYSVFGLASSLSLVKSFSDS